LQQSLDEASRGGETVADRHNSRRCHDRTRVNVKLRLEFSDACAEHEEPAGRVRRLPHLPCFLCLLLRTKEQANRFPPIGRFVRQKELALTKIVRTAHPGAVVRVGIYLALSPAGRHDGPGNGFQAQPS
jgi:hypothetical protein